MFLSNQSNAGINLNLDYWSDYFPRLAALAGEQNLHRIGAFTPKILRSFIDLCPTNFLVWKKLKLGSMDKFRRRER